MHTRKVFQMGDIGFSDPDMRQRMRMKQPGKVDRLSAYIGQNGSKHSVFRTVGQWKTRPDVRNSYVPVYVPWIVLDIDREDDLILAWGVTRRILKDLENRNTDMSRVCVSFSGGKGFHVEIHASIFGTGVFPNSHIARDTFIFLSKILTKQDIDSGPLSPLSMIRITGSKHTKTGLYKVTWEADDFYPLEFHDVISMAQSYKPYVRPYFDDADYQPQMRKILGHAYSRAQDMDIERQTNGKGRIGKPLRYALDGLREGENWSQSKAGRDWAAFTIACYCLEDGKQLAEVRNVVGVGPNATLEETMNKWNKRNTPPLADYKIEQKIHSAKRYLSK